MARRPSRLRLARDALGKNVRVYRAKQNISQTAFAVQAGTTQATVSAIELGEANPRLTTLAGLAEVLDRDVSELFVDPDRTKE
jgi:transcriptional regulator with XRE-family HTH domain